ncbi:MAG: hypothetical protein HFE57_01935 [Firmicutes bacterium]|jgi:hypothetical protein|nr:hypothetical protein [Bacillota bacterium]
MQIINRNILKIPNANLIDELNLYIEPVDKNWKNRIKPSDKQSIDLLKEYLGMNQVNVNFPNSFINFCYFAGKYDGGLLSTVLKGDFSIYELIEFNKEIYDFYKEDLDPFNFEFLTDEVGMGYIIKQNNNVEIGIYYEGTCFISSSFEKLLFQCAVRLYEEKYFLEKICFGLNINLSKQSDGLIIFDKVRKICQLYDLKEVWFNDDYFYFAYCDSFSIFLLNHVGIVGQIAGNDLQKIKDFSKKIETHIEIKMQIF